MCHPNSVLVLQLIQLKVVIQQEVGLESQTLRAIQVVAPEAQDSQLEARVSMHLQQVVERLPISPRPIRIHIEQTQLLRRAVAPHLPTLDLRQALDNTHLRPMINLAEVSLQAVVLPLLL